MNKVINVSNLIFKVCSSDSSSSSSEEEEGATEDQREKIKLEKFVRKATQKHQELKEGKQIKDGCQYENPHMGPEDPSKKKIPIIFFKAKLSEIAKYFQKCKS